MVGFKHPEHQNLLRGAYTRQIMVEEIRGSVNFPYHALQQCWSSHKIAPDARLQFLCAHQPLLPKRPGEPGIAYAPCWLKQAEMRSVPLVIRSGSDAWTFCGMYKAELVDVFEPVVWDEEPEEVSRDF